MPWHWVSGVEVLRPFLKALTEGQSTRVWTRLSVMALAWRYPVVLLALLSVLAPIGLCATGTTAVLCFSVCSAEFASFLTRRMLRGLG